MDVFFCGWASDLFSLLFLNLALLRSFHTTLALHTSCSRLVPTVYVLLVPTVVGTYLDRCLLTVQQVLFWQKSRDAGTQVLFWSLPDAFQPCFGLFAKDFGDTVRRQRWPGRRRALCGRPWCKQRAVLQSHLGMRDGRPVGLYLRGRGTGQRLRTRMSGRISDTRCPMPL